jgi:hypothetical protein
MSDPEIESMEASRAPRWRRLVVVLVTWGAAALAVAASGVLERAPRPVIPLLLLAPVVGFFVAARRPGLAQKVRDRVPLEVAIGLHVVRALAGATFLWAQAHGRLPAAFAIPAGVGDILAGVGALGAIAVLTTRPAIVRAWNLLALADIVLVVVNAQRFIVFAGAAAAAPFLAFPFPVLPLFVVPLVLVSHGIIRRRLGEPAVLAGGRPVRA